MRNPLLGLEIDRKTLAAEIAANGMEWTLEQFTEATEDDVTDLMIDQQWDTCSRCIEWSFKPEIVDGEIVCDECAIYEEESEE